MGLDHGLLSGLIIFYCIATISLFGSLTCEAFKFTRRPHVSLFEAAGTSAKACKLALLVLAWVLFTTSGAVHLHVFLNSEQENVKRIKDARTILFVVALFAVKITWIPAGALTKSREILVSRVLKIAARVSVGVIATLGIAVVIIVGVMGDEWRGFRESGNKTPKFVAPAVVVMVIDIGTWILVSIISLLYALHFRLSNIDKLAITIISFLSSTLIGFPITTFSLHLTRHPPPSTLPLLLTAELSIAIFSVSLPNLYLCLTPNDPEITPTDHCIPIPPTPPITAYHLTSFVLPTDIIIPLPAAAQVAPFMEPAVTVDLVEGRGDVDWEVVNRSCRLGVLPDEMPDVVSSLGSEQGEQGERNEHSERSEGGDGSDGVVGSLTSERRETSRKEKRREERERRSCDASGGGRTVMERTVVVVQEDGTNPEERVQGGEETELKT